jgi:hypothetical protein
VGKTSLINALKDGLSQPIAPKHRTVSVQVSRQLLHDGVDLRIWDFAGGPTAALLPPPLLPLSLHHIRRRHDPPLLQGRRCTTCPTPCISRSAASTS